MPVLNIMATQASVLNSGSSSSAPSRIRPNFVAAMITESTRKASAATTKNQPKVSMTQASPDSPKPAREPRASTPHATTASTPLTLSASTVRSIRPTAWSRHLPAHGHPCPSCWAGGRRTAISREPARPDRADGSAAGSGAAGAGQAGTAAASSASTCRFQSGLLARQPSSSMPRRQ